LKLSFRLALIKINNRDRPVFYDKEIYRKHMML
jgi:hypothetical protein